MENKETETAKAFFEKIKPKFMAIMDSLKNPVIQADIKKAKEIMSKEDFDKQDREGKELGKNLANSIMHTIKTKELNEKRPAKTVVKKRKKVKFK